MENETEERYVFLRSCNADFCEALRLLEDADSLPPKIAYALLRYAVIVYFRPFTQTKTRFFHVQRDRSKKKQIRLLYGFIPDDLMPLHEELRTYRESAYAHSDIAIRNPRLHYWRGHSLEFPIAFSPVDKKPLHIHVKSIKYLCKIGLEWVDTEIRAMEDQFRLQYAEK